MGSGNRVSPPQLIQYDQWGRRVDELHTSEGWRDLKAMAQKEGLPAIFYERKYGEHSRAYGFAKMMLMVGDSHMVRFTYYSFPFIPTRACVLSRFSAR